MTRESLHKARSGTRTSLFLDRTLGWKEARQIYQWTHQSPWLLKQAILSAASGQMAQIPVEERMVKMARKRLER
jgi:hypothetical protein